MPLIKPAPSPDTPQKERRDYQKHRGPGLLLQQLKDPRPMVRRWGARDLVAFPGSVPALLNRLRTETVEAVREAIFSSLVSIGTREVVDGLLPFLGSEEAALRNAVLEVLRTLPEQVAPVMDELLRHQTPEIRMMGVELLRDMDDPNTRQWLQFILEEDPSVNVCALAADCARERHETALVPALQHAMDRFGDEPFLRYAILTAIARLQHAE